MRRLEEPVRLRRDRAGPPRSRAGSARRSASGRARSAAVPTPATPRTATPRPASTGTSRSTSSPLSRRCYAGDRLRVRFQTRRRPTKASANTSEHHGRDEEQRRAGDGDHDRGRDGREGGEHERVRAVAGEVLARRSCPARRARASASPSAISVRPYAASRVNEADDEADDADEAPRSSTSGNGCHGAFGRASMRSARRALRRARRDRRRGRLRAAARACSCAVRHGQPEETLPATSR